MESAALSWGGEASIVVSGNGYATAWLGGDRLRGGPAAGTGWLPAGLMIDLLLAISGGALVIAILIAVLAGIGNFPKIWQANISRFWLALVVLGAASALAASWICLAGNAEWNWGGHVRLGGQLVVLQMDAVSAFFLALVSVIGGVGAIYAGEYWSDITHPDSARIGRICWSAV